MVGKAGAEALKTLDDSFVPAPSTIDRATLVVLVKPGRGGAPVPNVPPGKGASCHRARAGSRAAG